ncbi:CYTH and CHAD domain-containing protein [Jatrophihabitans sp. YIM 134969]
MNSAPTAQLETEDTYRVDDDFDVPPLGRFVPTGGQYETVTSHLRSAYLDTPDHALLRAHVTLRRREGDDDQGWHLKVPAGSSRTELHRPLGDGPENVAPRELTALVAGVVDGRELRPAAVIVTTRVRHRLLDAAGDLVLEVDDDRVAATPSGADTRHWREVEVELGTGSDRLLAKVGKALRAAGASPAAVTSKLARTLEDDTDGPERVLPAAATLRAYLGEQVDAIVAGDVDLRRGADPVHPTRVATRRVRSTVRVFADLVDPERAAWIDRELQWWAGELGAARDAQVQRARHRESLDALGPDLALGPVRARLDQDTTAAETRARERIAVELDGERYRTLLAELLRWRTDPPLSPAADTGRGALRRDAAAASRRADKRLRQALRADDDVLLHRARKAAKRARYAQELVASAEDGAKRTEARAAAKRHQRVQTVLGDHQDGVVAAELLRRLGAEAGARGENGFTFGVLWQREQARAEAARRRALTLR